MQILSVVNRLFESVESKSLSFSDHAYSFKSLFVLTLIVSAAAVTTAVLGLPAAFGLVVAASTLGIMTILSGIRGLWGVNQARLQAAVTTTRWVWGTNRYMHPIAGTLYLFTRQ